MLIPDSLKRFPIIEATYTVLCNFGRLNLPEIPPEELMRIDEDIVIPMGAPLSADLDAPSADLFFLLSLARSTKPKRILEVGTFRARTTCALKINCPNATITSYDIAAVESPFRTRLLKESGVEFRLANFANASPSLVAEEKYDLIFVDGSHTFEDALADSRIALQIVSPTGFIVWHDYRMNIPVTHRIRVPEALDRLVAETGRAIFHVSGTTCAIHSPALAKSPGR